MNSLRKMPSVVTFRRRAAMLLIFTMRESSTLRAQLPANTGRNRNRKQAPADASLGTTRAVSAAAFHRASAASTVRFTANSP